MKDRDKYNQFIYKIKSYSYDKEEYKELKDKLDLKWYKLSGVSGVNPSKSPIQGFNQSFLEEMKHEEREQIEAIIKRMNLLDLNIKYVDYVLNLMSAEVKQLYIDIYINKKSYNNLSINTNSSVGHIQYLMKKSFLELDL